MLQKTNLMPYLTTGIKVLSLVFLIGCEPKSRVEYSVKAKWIYINETDYRITYRPNNFRFNTFILEPKDTVVYDEDGEGPEDISEKNYVPPLNPDIVVFSQILCDTLLKGEGPLNIDNYSNRKLGERYYEFTYRFNSNDIDRADTCR